jgi:hypothetical protein
MQLAGTEHEPHLRILELFAYGKYKDYAGEGPLRRLTSAVTRVY